MSDELQLQITAKDEGSSLSLSKVRSQLVARGRRDAAILAFGCNKCGEARELVLAGCVCARCSNALDEQWARANTTDWVLITKYSPVIDIMEALKRTLAIKGGKEPDDVAGAIPARRKAGTVPNRYIYRNSTYAQMRSHWATCEPSGNFYLGPATPEEMTQAKSLSATSAKQPDTPFIRPATPQEIAEHDARELERRRDKQQYDVVAEIQNKWGFDTTGWDEDGLGIPLDGIWDEDADRRADEAFQETKKRLEELGLLKGTPYEYGSASCVETRRLAKEGEAWAQLKLGNRYYNASDVAEAVRWYKKAAEQGHAMAQLSLGCAYHQGEGVPLDYAEAAKWWRLGDYNLGVMFETAEDYPEAVEWYCKAADAGDADAQYNLGRLYHNGRGVDQDYVEAARWYRKAAEEGNADAQVWLGVLYANGEGVAHDYAEAARWWRQAAQQGNADAQKNLGVMYETGDGVPQDYAEAVKWYRKAADAGNAVAQNALGRAHYYGQGVAQDYVEAVTWYRKAAEQGNPDAQYDLGVCYYRGQGITQDHSEAARWCRKAAEQENAEAQCNLGGCYDRGEGVSQDYSEALKWYRKAAEQGNADAQFSLGIAYSTGKVVPQDYVLAHMHYNLATSTSVGEDRQRRAKARDDVAKKLTPQQIGEAQRLAGAWKPR